MKRSLLVIWFAFIGVNIYLSEAWMSNSARRQKPVNCAIGKWGVWGACKIKDKGKSFLRYRTRSLIPARNGGKPCPKNVNLSDKKSCSKEQAQATLFMSSLASSQKRARSFSSSTGLFRATGIRRPFSITPPKTVCPVIMNRGSFLASGKCQPPRTTRTKRQLDPLKHRDVLLLLDESGSVGSTNFEYVKEAAIGIITAMQGVIEISSDRTRVAMATFDKENHHQFNFNSYYTKPGLRDAIDEVDYNRATSGSTCMANALKFSKTHMFIPIRGSRTDVNTEKLVVMITDGCANCVTAQQLEDVRRSIEPIAIMVLHIGPIEKCRSKLEALQDGSQCFQTFNIETWNGLREFAEELRTGAIPWETWHDFDRECNPL